MEPVLQSTDEVVEQIMKLHKNLPPRSTIDEIEASKAIIRNVEQEDEIKFESISKQVKNPKVPLELFLIYQEMHKNFLFYQSNEQKRDALKLLDIEKVHSLFDDLIQRASNVLGSNSPSSHSNNINDDHSNGTSFSSTSMFSGNLSASGAAATPTTDGSVNGSNSFYEKKEPAKSFEQFAKDDSYLKKSKPSFYNDGISLSTSIRPQIVDSSLRPAGALGQAGEKLSLIKLASLIEVSSKKGVRDLILHNNLMDQIEWLPDSIGKLSGLITLDLSENRISALPATIGNLSSLTKLDLHSNRLSELPQSIGDLHNLFVLDLRGNELATLPSSIAKLVRLQELDLSSNHVTALPEAIGSLTSLKILNIETNDLEEIPHTIGNCLSLVELRADYNRLKALPEAVGRIETLEVLSVRYNNIKQLPTTMSSLVKLRELDVSFNELESVPESLCFATSLVKMNIGNNFADMRSLPRSIGNLEMLEELDMSNNQIRVLPESFRMLTKLRVLRAEENPLEVPPRSVAEKGAQAVVQYMEELVSQKNHKIQPVKTKSVWTQICCFSVSNERKRTASYLVNA